MTVGAWEGYWQYTPEAAAHRAGGAHEPVLARFWTALFESRLADRSSLRVLDVACGNGAALGYLFSLVNRPDGKRPRISAVGLDGSHSALVDLRRRMPEVAATAADVRRIPFHDRSFDLVMSQFGMEYGGPETVSAASRLVAPGGTLAAVLHLKDGGIYRECALNLRAIAAMDQLLPCARETLSAGIAASTGSGDRNAFRAADRRFAQAVAAMETIFRECGTHVAGSVIHRLYSDIGHIYRNLGRFVEVEVTSWLDRMSGEMETYRGRMQAMLDAALDERQFTEVSRQITGGGMQVETWETLRLGDAGAAAWILVARRPETP